MFIATKPLVFHDRLSVRIAIARTVQKIHEGILEKIIDNGKDCKSLHFEAPLRTEV